MNAIVIETVLYDNGVKGANLNHAVMGFDARMRGENP